MPNTLHLTAENPDDLLNASAYGAGAVIQVQSGAAEAGPFADDGTVALVAGTRGYTYFDADGTSSTWYRTRYENAAGTVASDWSAAFQTGLEGGAICSIFDVEQQLSGAISANNRELLLEFIRDATTDIEGYCKRWFVPRPLSGTTTYVLTPEITLDEAGRQVIWFPKGVRSITALGYATADQPDTGGSFTSIDVTKISLQPGTMDRDVGWPATKVVLLDTLGALLSAGLNRLQATGAFGFAAVPSDIAGIGRNIVIRRFTAKGSGVAMAVGSTDFTGRVLRWVSPEEKEKLDWYMDRQARSIGMN